MPVRSIARRGSLALLASAITAGVLVSSCGKSEESKTASAGSDCPKAAVVQEGTTVTPVTKANYAVAETEVILADYVRKIAKGTCSDGVGVFLHQRAAMDPKERTILRSSCFLEILWILHIDLRAYESKGIATAN